MQLFTPLEYLMIDIANSFGLDQENWDVRIDWFKKHQFNLFALLKQAKEPAMFYAGVQAYYQAVAGHPIGYPISLDATASGMQILACLTGDRKAASICNVIDSGKRENAYARIHEEMCKTINSEILPEKAKLAIMTSFYGSKAIPEQVFPNPEVLQLFKDTMSTMAPAAWELNQLFLSIWNPNAIEYSWTLPDNFHVKIKIKGVTKEIVTFLGDTYEIPKKVVMPQETGRSLSANTVHSLDGMIVREIVRRCSYNPERVNAVKQMCNDGTKKDNKKLSEDDKMVMTLWNLYEKTGFLSARIIDHLQPSNMWIVDADEILSLLSTYPAKPFDILTIHDCFRVHPNYANDLRTQYNLQLAMIAKSDLLAYLLTELVGYQVVIHKRDNDLWKDVILSNYALS